MKEYRMKTTRMWELPLLLAAVAVGLCLLLFALPYFAPLVIGAVLSAVLEPMVRWLGKPHFGIRIPRTPAALISILLLLGIVGTLIFWLLSALFAQVSALIGTLPQLWPKLVGEVRGSLESLFLGLGISPDRFWVAFDALSGQLSTWVQELASVTGKWILGVAVSIPGGLLAVFLSLLATFFLTKDKPRYRAFFQSTFPLSITRTAKKLYSSTLKALIGYIKAQGILMSITFFLMLLSFHLMGIDYAVLLSVVIAFFDALPAIGAGAFLIPWALVSAILGNYPMAVEISLIYLMQTLMRQCLEPRIVGQHIGMNPLITMVSMYAGLKLCGILGLLFAPFFVIILKSTTVIYLDGKTYRERVDGRLPHEK